MVAGVVAGIVAGIVGGIGAVQLIRPEPQARLRYAMEVEQAGGGAMSTTASPRDLLPAERPTNFVER